MTRGETISLVQREPWLGAGEMTRLLKAHFPFPGVGFQHHINIQLPVIPAPGELALSSNVQGKPTNQGRSLPLCSPVPRAVCVSLLF